MIPATIKFSLNKTFDTARTSLAAKAFLSNSANNYNSNHHHHKLPENLRAAIYEPPIGDKLNEAEKLKLKQAIQKNYLGYKNLQDKGSKLEAEQERVDDGVYR